MLKKLALLIGLLTALPAFAQTQIPQQLLAAPSSGGAGTFLYWNSSAWVPLVGNASGTLCLQETSAGVPSWAACSGGGVAFPQAVTGGISGGLPYFSNTTTLSASALLTQYALMVGGGVGAAPSVLASLGTTTTVLHGNASGAPTFGAVAVSTDVGGLGTGVATALGNTLNASSGLVGYSGSLGTPTQGVLSSATGLPISTGVSGLGTGVATALADAVNTSGGFPTVPVANAQLANSSITIAGHSVSLGGTQAIACADLSTSGTGCAAAVASSTSGNVAYYSASSATVSGESLSALIDSSISSTQGSILYRGASTWVALSPGTSGWFLKTQGASSNPIWAAVSGGSGCSTSGIVNEILGDNGSGGCQSFPDAYINAGQIALGAQGSVVGSVLMANATSGTLTIQPVSGALGTVTASFPANTGTIAELNLAQTWGAVQTFPGSDIDILGSSTGFTALASANAGASNFTATYPANTGTIAELNLAQSWTAIQTLSTPVINGLPTGTGVASAATASTLATRDSNANLSANNFLAGYTTTATAAGTTTLTVASTYTQIFTGTNTQTVQMPAVSALALGTEFLIVNNSTGLITIQSSGSNTIIILASGTYAYLTSIATSGTSAGVWLALYPAVSVTSSKVLAATNNITLAGTDATTWTGPSTNATLASLNITDQSLTGGATVTPYNPSAGAYTVDCGKSPLQWIADTGAFTLTAPANDGACTLQVEMGSGAATITFSGWTVGSNIGDALVYTSGDKFKLYITRVHSISSYTIQAMQ